MNISWKLDIFKSSVKEIGSALNNSYAEIFSKLKKIYKKLSKQKLNNPHSLTVVGSIPGGPTAPPGVQKIIVRRGGVEAKHYDGPDATRPKNQPMSKGLPVPVPEQQTVLRSATLMGRNTEKVSAQTLLLSAFYVRLSVRLYVCVCVLLCWCEFVCICAMFWLCFHLGAGRVESLECSSP